MVLMKKLLMTAVMLTVTVCGSAQSKPEPYFSFKELPNMLKWAPAPPDTIGAAFTYDIMQYMWGKQMRLNKERADIAYRDAEYSLECIMREFSEPFGLKISEEETPEIYKLLRDAKSTFEAISGFPKYYYKRKRPFIGFDEATLAPQYEPDLRRIFSLRSYHLWLGNGSVAHGDQSRACRYHLGSRHDVWRKPCDCGCSLAERRRCRSSGGCRCLCPYAHQRTFPCADALGASGVPC